MTEKHTDNYTLYWISIYPDNNFCFMHSLTILSIAGVKTAEQLEKYWQNDIKLKTDWEMNWLRVTLSERHTDWETHWLNNILRDTLTGRHTDLQTLTERHTDWETLFERHTDWKVNWTRDTNWDKHQLRRNVCLRRIWIERIQRYLDWLRNIMTHHPNFLVFWAKEMV